MRQFKKVAVGGTFDKLHKGHRALLGKAFEVGEKVVIGLTSDSFVAKMGKPHKTASYDERRRELEAYLSEQGCSGCAEIVPLNDAYGLTISGQGFDALVVSQDTLKIGCVINEKRQKAGLEPLQIVVVDLVPAENHHPISTTRIRRGEIDRNGRMIKHSA
ncbi:MAG: phosphopantetheine adenylyltransferase [Candidatus Bathyarchaeota archaeon]|nr:phosphopantetheine adenylyltransferase [Candidatus Bathyarchaeota archaeon]